jgi:DNA topoisomerase-1
VSPVLKQRALRGDPRAAAAAAGLRYTSDAEPGIRRIRAGKGFCYRTADGRVVRDRAALARIRVLAIPPAWRDVWICPDEDGHLQAVGRDARGRKQYRYHARFRDVRDAAKYLRLVDFCRVLPRLRRRVARDLACACLCREKVVAIVVSLLERAQLRVGNDEYARANDAYGATTLLDRHVKIAGGRLELRYRGKGGADRHVVLHDARLARLVRRCQELPGQRLFQYLGDDGSPVPVTSTDVNEYLREATGGPFTAKDFRTWAASIACAVLLAACEECDSERARKIEVNRVVKEVARQLGNTPAVCRRSYIHPRVIDGYMEGRLAAALAGVSPARAETALAAYLERDARRARA